MTLVPSTTHACYQAGCVVPVTWARFESGKSALIEIEALPVDPKPGLVIVNHKTGGGRVLNQAMIDEGHVAAWMAKHDMTLHRVHWANLKCPVALARKQEAARKKAERERAKDPQQQLGAA